MLLSSLSCFKQHDKKKGKVKARPAICTIVQNNVFMCYHFCRGVSITKSVIVIIRTQHLSTNSTLNISRALFLSASLFYALSPSIKVPHIEPSLRANIQILLCRAKPALNPSQKPPIRHLHIQFSHREFCRLNFHEFNYPSVLHS